MENLMEMLLRKHGADYIGILILFMRKAKLKKERQKKLFSAFLVSVLKILI